MGFISLQIIAISRTFSTSEACVTSVTKAMAQRLENWKSVLGQYRYAIEHIPGERNCWGDLLSRWVKAPSVPVRSVAVHSPCDADDSLPSVDVIRAAQRKAVADLGDNLRSFPTTFGQVSLADDLFRVRVGSRDVLWIPSGDKALQVRLMVCAHMRSAGHRGCLLYTSPSPRDGLLSRMPSSA